MLSGVDHEFAAREGIRRSAQPRPAFQQLDLETQFGAAQRGRHPGQPATDHHHPPAAHGAIPASDRAATPAFRQPDSTVRCCNAARGSAAMRASSSW